MKKVIAVLLSLILIILTIGVVKMSDSRKYYVFCEDNCKFEGMTKEQIITAIEQAISTGEITDIDSGFITKIKEQNSGADVKIWVGTAAEYNALSAKADDTLYLIKNDSALDDALSRVQYLESAYNNITDKIGKPLLWSGEAAAGNAITVQGSDQYNLFAIVMGNDTQVFVGWRHRGAIMAECVNTMTNQPVNYYFFATIDGNSWNIRKIYSMTHNASGDHSAVTSTDMKIIKIFGIM